jgi:MFS family permease
MPESKIRARRTLWVVAAAELLATSLWFAGTLAIPQLTETWQTDLGTSSWLTMAVQLGFVVGALAAAVFNLPDVFSATKVFAVSSVAAAVANALFVWLAVDHMFLAMVMRFLVGMFLAGVYPVGMKILAGWFRDGRGTALGVLVGALTVGKAMPYAVHGAGELHWQVVGVVCSGFAVAAAVLVVLGVKDGPYTTPAPPVDFHQVGEVFRNRRLRLANFGYFGHMWELYSMWGWIALLLAASAGHHGSVIGVGAFLAIASGAIGSYWAGRVADKGDGRKGEELTAENVEDTEQRMEERRVARRAQVTIVAMAVSAACCLLVPLVFGYFWVLLALSLVWGVAVVADSAQFSTIVSEVADRRYVGTALTLQTAIGFLLTVVSIRIIGSIGEQYGWQWAAAAMSIGPLLGIWAMWRLQANPTAQGSR